jgi:uncharacterized protein YkwD
MTLSPYLSRFWCVCLWLCLLGLLPTQEFSPRSNTGALERQLQRSALLALSTNPPGAPALSYPPDPTADIPWSGGTSGVIDIQNAFNHARTVENGQLGLLIPSLSLPAQATWDLLSDSDKALWLINRERIDRGLVPLQGVLYNVVQVAQTYAQYLLDHDVFGHYEDGRSPWERLAADPLIGACHDFLSVAENLAVFVTSGNSISLPVERSVYLWMYADQGSGGGHRHAILWYPYNDNSPPSGAEGFLGIGRASGGPYQGPFSQPWNFAEIIDMNVFDPCASWRTHYLPMTISQ